MVDLDNRFEEIVIDGLEVSLRNPVREKMNKNEKLLGKENNGVINSVNMVVCEQYNKSRPSYKLCTNLAEILKAKSYSQIGLNGLLMALSWEVWLYQLMNS